MRTFNLLGPSADDRVSEVYGLAPYLVYKVGDKTYNYGQKVAPSLFYTGTLSGVNPTEILAIGADVTSLNRTFRGKSSIVRVHAKEWDTSAVTLFNQAFNACTGLVSLDLSNLKTNSATSMDSMFYACSSLTTLGLMPIPSGCVTTVMFSGCTSLKDVRCGGLIYPSVSFIQSPLTAESVIDILEHLADTPDAGATITFKSGLYATYSAEDKVTIDTLVTAVVANGWTIVNMS